MTTASHNPLHANTVCPPQLTRCPPSRSLTRMRSSSSSLPHSRTSAGRQCAGSAASPPGGCSLLRRGRAA